VVHVEFTQLQTWPFPTLVQLCVRHIFEFPVAVMGICYTASIVFLSHNIPPATESVAIHQCKLNELASFNNS
jgi:hypothetical protein